MGTAEGAYRFAPADHFAELRTAQPRGIYTTADGLAGPPVRTLFEDSGAMSGSRRFRLQSMVWPAGMLALRERLT
jgi:hypothetical protein